MNPELEKWMDKWDAAQEKGIFNDAPKPAAPEMSDFFGNYRPAESDNFNPNDVDAKYWDKVYRHSNNQSDAPDPLADDAVINEDTKENIWEKPQTQKLRDTPSKDSLANAAAELANTGNPIYPSTRGMDQRNKVTPDWADGMKVREIAEMKYKLYTLECKLNSSPKFGAFGKDAPEVTGIQDQIDDIKERLDKLSNALSPDFIEDESS